ncbi:hypothetical protein GBA52_011624 [Prunus armeniaca]|nr:hypothetical protein GBA52_011624 [Prunus armeniaca]
MRPRPNPGLLQAYSSAASPSSTKRHTKFSVIGAGNVVMAIAQTILTQDLTDEYDNEAAVKSLEQVK